MKKNEMAIVSLKRKKNGGLDLSFVEHISNEDGSAENNEWILKCNDAPHPELTTGLYDLKQYLATCLGMLDVRTVMIDKALQEGAKTAFTKVVNHLEKMMQIRLGKLDVTGFKVSGSIVGEKDKRAVVILGTFEQEDGTKMAINSPLIKFDKKTFNFEDEVKELIDDLEEEVKEYISGRKRAQQKMFGSDAEAMKVA